MPRTCDLLIIDDDRGHVALIETLIGILELPHHCHHAPTGVHALQFLKSQPPYEGVPRPHLILLDINMPGKKGLEVLREIKSDQALRSIPVIMFSSTENDDEITDCYHNHANAYITKPHDLEAAFNIVKALDGFWMQTIEFASQ